ncbi:carbohydrate ABC transporter permease [Bifidobacterium longum]|jgi:multiple sugar transport system permease protein|uniref:Carbohydrate ABC transporter permease n=2 Tax=Bifidobacterium longum TaxID=216816 RepID=A0A9Q8VI91_BIFLL|nr:carbohydrate ABC transporter permease [Bifidobacterium longum]MBL3915288.1 carbohydrate ABC transporter permease [Bifidobacterium longum subsp. suis]PWH08879.1 ABC transporter permease [Bifidobacterium longum]TCE71665.1 ABC transporter permease [Bifidobacterium longum subsp. longum]UNL65245.1 carbohydrate ABC transporter permease [Bifidobacterium longum subsp. longum]UNL67224.1 carbohydrate ABC transporter permease [Bifidobacterium longum subsp. longum]
MHRKNTGKVVQYALLVLFFVILIGPLLWQLTLAFKGKGDDIYAVPPYVFPKDPTFDNFIEAFNRIPVLKYFGNSLIVAAISVCGNVVGSTLAGYALARLKFWGKRIVVLMIFSAMLIPGETLLISQFIIVKNFGLQNTLLGAALPGLCSAMNVLLMMNAFSAIPMELEEAAKVDGANVWQRFFNVCLPQVKGTMTVVTIFAFVGAWNDFLWPLIILGDDSVYTLTVGLNRLKNQFVSDPRLIAAGTVIALVPIIIFFLIFQRYFFKGVEEGGIKG